MGFCYMKLSQLDAAEETFSQALTIYTDLLPKGNDHISRSETISTEIANVVNDEHTMLFLQLNMSCIRFNRGN